MRNRLLALAIIFLVHSNIGLAQMVGANCFLQGQFLEVGIEPNGSFGPTTSPAGYHPHPGFGTALAMVYDYGHDGWGVGAPPFMGDYTYPGYPQEGWAIQINGNYSYAYQPSAPGYVGPLPLTGATTSYSVTPGMLVSNWAGTAGAGLVMRQETRVDVTSSWIVVTTYFHNTTAATMNNVYYMRTADPDNDVSWPGGSFSTTNVIVHQNDVDHRVQVSAVGPTGGYTYMALGTKDCRAKAFICQFGLVPINFLDQIYNQTGGAAGYTYTGTYTNDVGYGLVYNLGNIAAGDSTIISYAYIFNGNNGIDDAFPEPLLVVNGIPGPPSGPAPAPTIDTFDVCAYPGMTTLPIDIAFAEDKCWSWSTWTWSPSLGLSATTGAHVVLTTTALPPVITYTITGTDSAVDMFSCNHRVMYLTIKTCNKVTHNNPCFGDTLFLVNHGDSTGATYYWWGPGGFTSTLQNPFIYPATYANAGTYHVVKTVIGIPDSDSTATPVIIHHKPSMVVTTNSPLCAGMIDTLFMFLNPDSATSITWVGPSGFSSTLTNPTVPNFTAVNAGTYTVYGVTPFGCKDTETTNVAIVPPPPPPTITGIPAYCFGSTFIPFTVIGSNILWYPTSASTVGTPIPPAVNTRIPGTYTYYATQTYGCLSPKDSITIIIYPRINPNFTFTVRNGCDADTVYFTNTSTNSTYYSWNFGDFTTDSASGVTTPLIHVFHDHAIHNVKLTGHNPVCSGDTTIAVDTRHEVKAMFSPLPNILCFGQGTTLSDSSYSTVAYGFKTLFSHTWTFGDGTSDVTNGTPPVHTYTAPGIYPVHLVVMDSLTCVDSITKNVYVLQVNIKSFHDTALCISQPLALKNEVSMYPNIGLLDYTYSWSPADKLDDATKQIPYFDGFGLITYTLTATETKYGCIGTDTIRINSVLGKKLLNVTNDQIITYGNTVQMNADNEILYWWKPDNGTLDNTNINNPIAKPTATTQYTVFGYDNNGCLDSAFVNIIVDSSMVESVPSAFTPNGDGLNDVFKPIGMKYRQLVDFRVFNRWGEQVFYSNNAKNGWDGTYKGEPQEMSVYYYTITVARPGGEGENVVYKGEVTLIR